MVIKFNKHLTTLRRVHDFTPTWERITTRGWNSTYLKSLNDYMDDDFREAQAFLRFVEKEMMAQPMEKERFSRNPLWLFDAVSSEMAQWSMQLVKLAALLRRYIVCIFSCHPNELKHDPSFFARIEIQLSSKHARLWQKERQRFGTVAGTQLDPTGAMHFTLRPRMPTMNPAIWKVIHL